MENVDKVQTVEDRGEAVRLDGSPLPKKYRAKPSLPVVQGLRPKQVHAAMMLAQGRMATEVARFVEVSPETISRWRGQPAFQLFVGELLQDTIEATKLGLVSLLPESIQRLGQVMFNMDDKIALKGINILFSKAGPLLAAINTEVQRPMAGNSGHSRELRSDRQVTPKMLAQVDAVVAKDTD